ncbi:MAG: AsmA family protein [Pseudomonadota bacterium]
MRWIMRLLGVIVLLAFFAIAAFFLIPSDRIAAVVEDRFEAATGRALTIEGDVRPSLWPSLGVRTGAVTIANAAWSDRGPLLDAEDIAVSVDLGALIGGDIEVNSVEIISPTIQLETDAEGQGNWVFDTSEVAASAEAAPAESTGGTATPAFSLAQATITDGRLSFRDAAGAVTELAAINAEVSLPSFDGPADINLKATANGQPVSAEIWIAAFASLLEGTSAAEIAATVGGSSIGYSGQIGADVTRTAGKIEANLADMPALFAAIGQPAPALPEGLGQNAINVTGDVSYTGAAAAISGATFMLDQNRLTGDLAVALDGPRPKIAGQLSAGALDLSALGGEEAEVAATDGAGSEGSGWSTDPIDVSGLGAADAEIGLSASSIALATSQLGPTRVFATLDNSRLVTRIDELNAYDGQIAGQIVVNGRGGLSASADLAGSAIAIARLFSELLDFDRLIALGDMEIEVLGVGNSMNAIMNSLDGQGSISLGTGELRGLDLVGMLRNFDTSFVGAGASTIFNSIGATFRIVDGVVVYDTLDVDAPLFTATGGGSINLGGQSLDMRLVPRLLPEEDEGLSIPLRISGAWSAPRFQLDLESLARDRLDAEIEQARDELEEDLKQKAVEELGLTDQTPDPEEALKDKVEEELKRGLRGLFD